MTRLRHASSQERKACFEQFEQRLVMSAQAVANLLPELQIAAPAITQQIISQPLTSTSVSPTTAAANLAAQYGFNGAGQTVAVIDSGIAWDHHALGGSFGQGSKVVGGWDFADNDANPYDSGAAAMHGTHVAGIVASEHERYKGVSSGADLVSLRVFNDQGEGNLEWVRQALQWVHQHRSSFENPITTVVMSLGTNWNAHNTPNWAMLETELAQLKQAGIFISVAAGNSFQDYNASGLSYPAVSSHVVPVASHDSSGQMSDFSQRSSRVLVAPGEDIRSAIPNHLFVNGMTNRFMALSGTSMAAPYVAGVSAILRQANEFMGKTGINQQLLYEQLLSSADQIFDAATNSNYSRINLGAALSQIIPDLEGNSSATAKSIGQIANGQQVQGTIGKLDDLDFFKFTAQTAGQVRLTINTTHDLDAVLNVFGSQATLDGNVVSFSVEAGREYQFSIATRAGIGHYTISTQFQSGPAAVQWGAIAANSFTNQTIQGESLYRLQATQTGILAIQTNSAQAGNLQLEVFDSQMNRIAICNGNCADLRLNVAATQGETYFLKATGNAHQVDFHLGNTVTLSGGVLTVRGTAGTDQFEVDAREGFAMSVNGMKYQFQPSQVQSIKIDGNSGADALTLRLGSQNDVVTTHTDGVWVRNQDFSLDASRINYSFIDGGSGNNAVVMRDSAGNDLFQGGLDSSTLQGAGFSTTVAKFRSVTAISSGGLDRAELAGSASNEFFRVHGKRSSMTNGQTTIVAEKFATNHLAGGGGNDRAAVWEAAGDREINVRYRFTAVHSNDRSVNLSEISRVNVVAQTGSANLRMFDSMHNDIFVVNRGVASLQAGNQFRADASGFKNIQLSSQSGNDSLHLYDTAGNDRFTSFGNRTELSSATLNVVSTGFAHVRVTSRWGGNDTAELSGTQGMDWLVVDDKNVTLHDSQGRARWVEGFQRVNVDLGTGYDTANYRGGSQAETLRVNQTESDFQSTNQRVVVSNARETRFAGGGGADQVFLKELNLLQGMGQQAVAFLDQHRVTMEDIATLEAQSVDHAMAEYDLDIVDFQYLLRGNWRPR